MTTTQQPVTYSREHSDDYWAEVHAQAAREMHQAGRIHDHTACGFDH
jgi:hypothetical protein